MSSILIEILVIPFISSAVWAFLGAFILQLATRLIAQFKLKYWQFYKITFLGFLGAYIVGFTLGIPSKSVFALILVFLVQAVICSNFLNHLTSGAIRFGTAYLISLVYVFIAGLIFFLMGIVTTLWGG